MQGSFLAPARRVPRQSGAVRCASTPASRTSAMPRTGKNWPRRTGCAQPGAQADPPPRSPGPQSKRRFARWFRRGNGRMVSTGCSFGLQGRRVGRARFAGTTGFLALCQPAPSATRWAHAPGATCRPIPAGWARLASVFAQGMTHAAPVARAGRTAPKMGGPGAAAVLRRPRRLCPCAPAGGQASPAGRRAPRPEPTPRGGCLSPRQAAPQAPVRRGFFAMVPGLPDRSAEDAGAPEALRRRAGGVDRRAIRTPLPG
jgi:hypothetical protein